jgi:hypothetical protein
MQVIATDDSRPPVNRGSRNRAWLRLIALLLAISLLAAGWYYLWPRQIDSTGGIYFPYRVALAVPRFAQGDERWGNDSLAGTPGTMAQQGCAVSSAAMVLSFYGLQLDPGQLNEFLIAHDGYTTEGWLRWEKAADFVPGKAKHVYEDLPSFFLIDSNLVRGNPVIIRLRLPGGVTHFVVIVGKRGFHYLIQDPGSGGEQGVYPLDQLTDKIEALRFYQKVSGA